VWGRSLGGKRSKERRALGAKTWEWRDVGVKIWDRRGVLQRRKRWERGGKKGFNYKEIRVVGEKKRAKGGAQEEIRAEKKDFSWEEKAIRGVFEKRKMKEGLWEYCS
jgi:hypothetical protein